jgi:hypothetical protein
LNRAADVLERYADGTATVKEVAAVYGGRNGRYWAADPWHRAGLLARAAARKRRWATRAVGIIRDVVGDPFGRVEIDPAVLAWGGGSVVRVAESAYDRRLATGQFDPARLAVLTDVLTDAGCVDVTILTHLRGEGLHMRGCWVVDLLLGRQ